MNHSIPDDINSYSRLEAARFYAGTLGWAVHPLNPPDRGDDQTKGKKPLLKGWRDHRAADISPEFLTKYFANGSSNNIGNVVRAPYVHVDLDSKANEGASVREWLEGQDELAKVPRERTGGGAHLVFRCRDLPDGIANAKKAPTVTINEVVSAELYVDGLNIVLSPSVHKNGHTYRWEVTGEIPEVKWDDLCRWFGFKTPEKKTRGRPRKEKPWWAKWQEDLRTLDLIKVARELGILGDCIDPDTAKWSIRCPWHDQHSDDKGEPGSDTIIFNAPETMPAFRCLHSHCDERGFRELVEWCEEQKPGIIAAHCTDIRVWQPGTKNSLGRPKIVLPAIGRTQSEFGAELGAAVAPALDLFTHGDSLVEIKLQRKATKKGEIPGHMLRAVRPLRLVTSIERTVETGVLQKDEAGDMIFMPTSMNEQHARITTENDQFLRRLPHITRILDVPVPVLEDGKLVYPGPGYDPRFETWLNPAAPKIRTMGFEEALRLIFGELLATAENGGFWWHDQQARVHALARLITPFCRGLMGWNRTPLWIYDGNREGSGKDTCADVAHNLYTGRNVTGAPLSKDCDDEMRKRITSALMQGARFFHLANMKGHVRYASLEAATDNSGWWEDRVLRASEAILLRNETEFSLSANNATWEPDIERRCRRIRLRFTPEYVNGHKYKHESVLGWVREHRSDLLSAVAALVAHWVRQGCPPGPTPFTSFPEWGRIVGGILTACGLPDPCLPHEESAVSGDKDTRSMRQFFAMGHDRFGNDWVKKNAVYEWVQQDEAIQELFEWIDFAARRGLVSFAKLLAKFDGRELGGVVFGVQRSSANYCKYQFFRDSADLLESPHTPHTPHTFPASESVRCEVEGDTLYATIGDKNKCEKKKKSTELKGGYRGNTESLTLPHTSHSAAICTAPADLDRIAADLTGASRIALDLETYGPNKGDGLDPWRGEIRLLTLGCHAGPIWTIDLMAVGYDLGPLAPILEAATLVIHNAKFDLGWLRVKCGLTIPKVFCTMTASRLLSAGLKLGNTLDACLERYLSVPPGDDQSRSDWGSMLLTEEQLSYAARDVAYLHDLAGVLESELEMNGLDEVWALESALLPRVVEMEAAGFAVEREKLETVRDASRAKAEQACADLRDVLGNPSLNPSSPAQLLSSLRSEGIHLDSTKEEDLKAADDGRLVPLVLAFRESEKRAQQAESLLDHIRGDGRIHARFEPTGTATGRFSSKEPNLQNIGRGDLREAFTPPEGRCLVVADYSQIELRAAAAIAGETRMMEAYRAGSDLHRKTAATVLGKSEDSVSKGDRQLAKACFSGDTEILTPNGWVRFDEYDGRTPVAQFELPEGISWNPPRPRSNRWGRPTGKVSWDGTGEIRFVEPLALKSFEDRELFHHEDRNTDLLLTEDHEVVYITNANNPTKRPAQEVVPGNCKRIVAAGFLARSNPDDLLEAFTRSLAMVVADGSFCSRIGVRFGFFKERKIRRCLDLLQRLGLDPRVSVTGKRTNIRVSNPEWVECLLSWITLEKNLSWRCLTGLPAGIYLEEAAYWDSHLIEGRKRRRSLFCTKSRQTAEVMQAMAATSGHPSTLRQTSCSDGRDPLWQLSYVLDGPSTWRASWNLKPTGRRERVWCVQVPSGAILVRRNGKVCVQGNCNFGLIYGQSAPGLVRYAATSYGVTMTGDQAKEIRKAFFRAYPALREWHSRAHQDAEFGAKQVRTRLGRRRLMPGSASNWERFTALVNTPVQGGTADGMKQAIVLVAQRIPPGSRLVSTVHDELVIECPEDDAEIVRDIVTAAMTEAMAALFPEVPVEVEANICTTWAEK